MTDCTAILSAYLDDELTEDQRREFVVWLNEAPCNIDRFVLDCSLDSCLQDIFREEQVSQDAIAMYVRGEAIGANQRPSLPATDDSQQAGCQVFSGLVPSANTPKSPSFGIIPSMPFAYVSSGWPVAYLVATAMTALGLWICANMYTSPPSQIVGPMTVERPVVSPAIPSSPLPEVVGRITGMADCEWSVGGDPKNPKSEIRNLKSPVFLGDRFGIQSGLLEITYNTGAQVILEGPVTYEVESKNGGFMGGGKLTGKVTTDAARGLTIRTPTATVTDLGTEFGVEVDKEKNCHVNTFVGVVKVSPTAHGLRASRTLAAGEALQVNAAGVMTKTPTQSTHFIRSVRRETASSYSATILQDHPIAYWPLDELPTAHRIADHSGHGCDGKLVGNARLVQGGPFGGGRCAEFSGNGCIQTEMLPKSDPANGFSVEVWAMVDEGNGRKIHRSPFTCREDRGVSASNHIHTGGFSIFAADDDRWQFQTGTGPMPYWAEVAGPPVVLGQWAYIVGTFKPTTGQDPNGAFIGIKRLYINGDLVATDKQAWTPNETKPARIGAGATEWTSAAHGFFGRVAEAAVYDHPLDEPRIKIHWEIGKHSWSDWDQGEKSKQSQ